METWRLLNTGYADGPTNMAVDEAILTCHAQGLTPPTLRFYGWQPSCLSIGVFQSVQREVDISECCSRGVGLVRRPTGGRAIFHASEVTYSLVANSNHPFVKGSISESYRRISGALAAGLHLLGADVRIAPRVSDTRRAYRNEKCADGGWIKTPACFDTPSDYELIVDGRKLVGSAQVRKRGAVLQHGSIMLDVDVASLVAILRLKTDVSAENQARMLSTRMTCLKEVLGREVAYQEVTESLMRGFQENASVVLVPSDLTEEERVLARQLREEKYLNEMWNFRR